MARVLILENDPMFAAALEDRLHVAGHGVVSANDGERLKKQAEEGGADLLILSLELPDGLDLVTTLRSTRGTRSVPILTLSTNNRSRDRVAALRAGVDDFLAKPCDLEELMIRASRLLGDSGPAPVVMQGDLANQSAWELMQYVQQAGKSGDLSVRGPRGSGQLRALHGKVDAARFGSLQGRDALLAILDLDEGTFRLVTEDVSPRSVAPDDTFSIPEVVLEAAWLQDELAKRQKHLPATGAALRYLTTGPPEIPDDLAELDLDTVAARIEQTPGIRLYDLQTTGDLAPQKVRLAVAWLAEQGSIEVAAPEEGGLMTTTEISSSMVLDVALHNLMRSARAAGFDAATLPYLLLVEEALREPLQKILTSVPGFRRIAPLRKLVDQLGLRKGGSATFETSEGKLSLHVQVLSPQVKAQVEAILPGCAGALLWIGEGGNRELVGSLVKRLASGDDATGILLPNDDASRAMVSGLAAESPRWRMASHPPQSLIGLLRLLHPMPRERI